ncbi:hypothetical protein MMC16_000502 [Acarospora aff. strigata]|nr:hypothetical protein [Acarospora aff. strigata]
MRNCRSSTPAVGFGIGLLSAWSILWSATLIVFNDARKDFKRIERQEKALATEKSTAIISNGTANGTAATGPETVSQLDARTSVTERQSKPEKPSSQHVRRRLVFAHQSGSFSWQRLPESITERLDWMADLVSNFRGLGWNWRVPGLPPLPPGVQRELQQNDGTEPREGDSHVGPTGVVVDHTKRELLTQKLCSIVCGYLILDICKALMTQDPYYWGIFDQPPPSYLPTLIATSPALLRTYRLTLILILIDSSLQTFFNQAPLFFVGLLGPKYIGARGEPWMYPDAYGSYRNVFDKGLAGWWGGWWHQTFRFAFDSSSKWLVAKLRWDRKSLKAKMLQLLIAFSISGALHACGSYTTWPPTRPLRPFLFFFLQTWGIIAQILSVKLLKYYGITRRTPKPVRQLVNFLYVHVWFFYTAPLLIEDFASGGIWLFEPIPISPLRALGFSREGEGWWRWGGIYLRWYSGRNWWRSGVAF